jgi:hypothetical protein
MVQAGMFCSFYIVKNSQISNETKTDEAREKVSTYFESVEFQKKLMHVWQNLKIIKIFFIKLSTNF